MTHSSAGRYRTSAPHRAPGVLLTVALGLWSLMQTGCAARHGEAFPSPQAAGEALAAAMSPYDETRLTAILGAGSEDVITSGDPVADRATAERFTMAYREKHATQVNDDGSYTLYVGANDWPFPIPLIPEGESWAFDTATGRQEIIDRRVGRNELATIEVCRAVVDAQREYYALDPDGDGVHEYAARFRSEPGKRDGLYWRQEPGQPPSPLGELAAEASAGGYTPGKPGERQAYHGYYYRMLTGQGPEAPGGQRDYMVNGNLSGGFGVVAWPATYGNSGIMTFIVSENGVVFQKDLGSDTEDSVAFIELFEPGAGWEVVP